MEEYGMWTWAPGNAPEITPSSFTMRTVYTAVLSPATWGNVKYLDIAVAGITPENASAFCVLAQAASHLNDKQLEPEVLNGVVRVWKTLRGDPWGNSGRSSTVMRLFVVRFK